MQPQVGKGYVRFSFSYFQKQNTTLVVKFYKKQTLNPNINITKILIAPLDWGLGHATRCIPIIRALEKNGYQLIIAGEGAQTHLLQTEFPNIPLIPLKGYRISYAKHPIAFIFGILMQVPKILLAIHHEKRWLRKMIQEQGIQLVISDNRYGLSSKQIPSVIITHQLSIKAGFPILERFLQKCNYYFLNQFKACWVPDQAGEVNLAGDLSHPKKLPNCELAYIGMLSRFSYETASEKTYSFCCLISGPEPQRSLLEITLLEQVASLPGKILMVRGKPGDTHALDLPESLKEKVTVCNHLPGDQLRNALLQSEYILCRSGYTSLMEIISLQKKAILIPTPGQTEQQYLGTLLHQKGIALTIAQSELSQVNLIDQIAEFPFEKANFGIFDETKLELNLHQLTHE